MFRKDATMEEELAQGMSQNLDNKDQQEYQERHTEAIVSLVNAANLFDEMGLKSQADAVDGIIKSLAFHVPTSDPATAGLTPEREVANIEHHGFPLNLPGDKSAADDGSEPAKETMDADDSSIEVSDEGVAS